jgi:hypothetical protein
MDVFVAYILVLRDERAIMSHDYLLSNDILTPPLDNVDTTSGYLDKLRTDLCTKLSIEVQYTTQI